jgi:hypothetical protein
LRVTPDGDTGPVALLVTGDVNDPLVACLSSYVQEPVQACVGGLQHRRSCISDADCPNGGACRTSATLGPARVERTPAEWGIVNVYAAGIRPSTRYLVQTDCGMPAGSDLSVAAPAVTWLWGDVDHSAVCNAGAKAGFPCNRDGDCPGGLCRGVSFADIAATVAAFKGAYTASLTMEAADLIGSSCTPNRDVNFGDIAQVVQAFKSIPFACAPPCP